LVSFYLLMVRENTIKAFHQQSKRILWQIHKHIVITKS
jgi:hypothetical protein